MWVGLRVRCLCRKGYPRSHGRPEEMTWRPYMPIAGGEADRLRGSHPQATDKSSRGEKNERGVVAGHARSCCLELLMPKPTPFDLVANEQTGKVARPRLSPPGQRKSQVRISACMQRWSGSMLSSIRAYGSTWPFHTQPASTSDSASLGRLDSNTSLAEAFRG